MKKLFITGLLLISSLTFSQVGIGTFNPSDSAELDVSSSDKGVLIPRVYLNDLPDLSPVVGGGEESLLVYNLTEDPSNGLIKGFYYWKDDKWNRILDINDFLSSSVMPTGLERLNEGSGDGWRLIGRNPLNYNNIGLGSVDFSYSGAASTEYGAGSNYSFIHGNYNKINGNGYLAVDPDKPTFSVIMGGQFNTIKESVEGITNGATIIGGYNTVDISQRERSAVIGDQNTIFRNTSGSIIGSKNQIGGNNTYAQGGIFGTGNVIRSLRGFIVGENNEINYGGRQTLLGEGLYSSIPFETVVGQYNANLSSGLVNSDDATNAYYTSTVDPVFRVGIGYLDESDNAIRKDGFRVLRNGKVQITQNPATDNSVSKLYGRAADGSFVLVDKSSLGGAATFDGAVDYSPVGTINLFYLETNYGGEVDFYRVYSASESAIYTKVDFGVWVKSSVTTVN